MGKDSFFIKIVNVINKLIPERVGAESKNQSRFSLYVRQVDRKHESYEAVRKAAELCDEAIMIAKQRIQIVKRFNMLNEKLAELECYENLTDTEIDGLKNLIERFMSLNKDRNALRFQMTGFDKGLVEMQTKEEDAKDILEHMEDSEKNRKILRQDINLLQGEKSDLEYEYLKMQNAGEFVHKLSLGLLALSALLTGMLGYMIFVEKKPVFAPVAILTFSILILMIFIYFFRHKIRREMRINLLKQQKCVGLINKKNVVYAYHINFLKFVYKKYNVRSAEKLRKNIRDYNDYKNITHRYDSIRNAMYQTEFQIESFLKEKNMLSSMTTIEKFAKTVNIDDKRKVYNDYSVEKNRMEKTMEGLDQLHNEIWNELTALSTIDSTKDHVVELIITQYAEEVENIIKINTPAQIGDDAPEETADIDDVMEMDAWLEEGSYN